jgi:SH3-like domain-containing protein
MSARRAEGRIAVLRAGGWVVLATVVGLAGARAHAEEAQVATAVVLRERADEGARVVARLPAGAKVTLWARRADWLQVRSRDKSGWAHAAFFKLGAEPAGKPRAAGAPASERSLAPPRMHPAVAAAPAAPAQPHVEGWVSRSTWAPRRRFDAEATEPGDVHARAAPESHVLATLHRGQRVRLERLSSDEAWGLVRADGADLGWVSMRQMRVRDSLPEDGAASAPAEPVSAGAGGELELAARVSPPERRTTLVLVADAGIAVIARRYVSNGASALASYELSATSVASGVAGSYERRVGSMGLIGVDLAYAYAGGARVRYGAEPTVGMQVHDAEAGLRLGLHSRAAGGVDVWLRAGALLTVTIFDPNVATRLQSDRLIAPTAGLGVALPHLRTVGDRWLGLDLFGRAVVLGQTIENVDEGKDRGTLGGRFGAELSLELWRTPGHGALLLTAAYRYAFSLTRFSGPSQRDPSATESTLGASQHLGVLALGYRYGK